MLNRLSLFVVLADKSLAMLLRKFIKQWECSIKMLWEKKAKLVSYDAGSYLVVLAEVS